MESHTVIIPARFCGPPASGNGGYTCALLAEAIGSTSEITLRKPIPIERELQIVPRDGSRGALLKDAETLIAEGEPIEWSPLPRRQALAFEDAVQAAQGSPAFRNHPFPTCFVCGPLRAAQDGLRIFPGLINRGAANGNGFPGGTFAAPWIPDKSLADAHGMVRDEFIWAALDCPTGFACGFSSAGTLVTGRLAVELMAQVHVGEKCVLLSWPLGIDGRKHHAAAALIGEDGTTSAEANATWIKLA